MNQENNFLDFLREPPVVVNGGIVSDILINFLDLFELLPTLLPNFFCPALLLVFICLTLLPEIISGLLEEIFIGLFVTLNLF